MTGSHWSSLVAKGAEARSVIIHPFTISLYFYIDACFYMARKTKNMRIFIILAAVLVCAAGPLDAQQDWTEATVVTRCDLPKEAHNWSGNPMRAGEMFVVQISHDQFLRPDGEPPAVEGSMPVRFSGTFVTNLVDRCVAESIGVVEERIGVLLHRPVDQLPRVYLFQFGRVWREE
jgi:hypothetical protein